jgi:hypothetical protein
MAEDDLDVVTFYLSGWAILAFYFDISSVFLTQLSTSLAKAGHFAAVLHQGNDHL